MKKTIITMNLVVMVSLMLFVGSAVSRPIAGTNSTATISFSNTYGVGTVGEFNIDINDDFGNDFNFIGFCLELNESIGVSTYNISSIENYAALGGVGGHTAFDASGLIGLRDDLSAESKWVYWNYLLGTNGFFGENRNNTLAENVQKTIWALEGETDYELPNGNMTNFFDRDTFISTSTFYSDVLGQGTNGGYGITGDVYALNIGEWVDGVWIHRQSLIVGEPVPEPATMLLFGAGLIGLAGFSYRRKKK